jgi:hypothetical protein
LQWPEGFPRTKSPERSRFDKKVTTSQAMDEIERQLRNLGGVKSAVISANAFLRGTPVDKGVALYFTVEKYNFAKKANITSSYVFPCDKWDKAEHNFWAIAKHLEALRGQHRWGVGSMERDFMGYTALPEQSASSWWTVMNVERAWPMELITERYRQLAKDWHPDRGGSNEKMVMLNRAYDEARKEKEKAL